jgi:hypothetical protein
MRKFDRVCAQAAFENLQGLLAVGNYTGVPDLDGGTVEGGNHFTAARHAGNFVDIFTDIENVVYFVIG